MDKIKPKTPERASLSEREYVAEIAADLARNPTGTWQDARIGSLDVKRWSDVVCNETPAK